MLSQRLVQTEEIPQASPIATTDGLSWNVVAARPNPIGYPFDGEVRRRQPEEEEMNRVS